MIISKHSLRHTQHRVRTEHVFSIQYSVHCKHINNQSGRLRETASFSHNYELSCWNNNIFLYFPCSNPPHELLNMKNNSNHTMV